MGYFLTDSVPAPTAKRHSIDLHVNDNVASPNPHRGPIFAGVLSAKYTDDETGLVMYQLRAYSPGMGRWITRDPIREQGGANIQEFCGNDPVSQVDPKGLVNVVVSGTDGDRIVSRGYTKDSAVTDYLDYAGRYYFNHIGDGIWDFESVGSFMTPGAYARKAWTFPLTAPATIGHSIANHDSSYLWNLLVPNAFRRDVEINGGRVADLITASHDKTDVLFGHSQGVTLAAAGLEMASKRDGVDSCKTIKMVFLAPKIESGYLQRLIREASKKQPGWTIKVLVIGSTSDNMIPTGTENGYIGHLGLKVRSPVKGWSGAVPLLQSPIAATHLLGFPLEQKSPDWTTYVVDTGEKDPHDSRKHTGVNPIGNDYDVEAIDSPSAIAVRKVIQEFLAK